MYIYEFVFTSTLVFKANTFSFLLFLHESETTDWNESTLLSTFLKSAINVVTWLLVHQEWIICSAEPVIHWNFFALFSFEKLKVGIPQSTLH